MLDIRAIRPTEIEGARSLLLQEEGWRSRFEDAQEFERLISKSQRAIVAVENAAVIGFARAISDDMSNGYLTLLIVAKGHRGRGIGRALVKAVVGDDPGMTWILRADPGASRFYENVGFVRSEIAMERPRARNADGRS